MSTKALLGFNFYGAGNIGDDLMLAGFALACAQPERIQLTCAIPRSTRSQERRFPHIQWANSIRDAQCTTGESWDGWVGIGDTPFQGSSGRWSVDAITASLGQQSIRTSKFMIGVGAEDQARTYSAELGRIGAQMTHVWARDARSRDIMVEDLGLSADRVTVGADLAHPFLRHCGGRIRHGGGSDRIAVNYFSEGASDADLTAIRAFFAAPTVRGRVAFVGTEVRAQFERRTFKRIVPWWQRFGPFQLAPMVVPDYARGSSASFANLFDGFGTVMSSRYHGILTAAWAGARVIALNRGSSKISTVAKELGIPLIESPFSSRRLLDALDQATVVDRGKLERLADRAIESVRQFEHMIGFC